MVCDLCPANQQWVVFLIGLLSILGVRSALKLGYPGCTWLYSTSDNTQD